MLPAFLRRTTYGKVLGLLLLLAIGSVIFVGLSQMNAPRGDAPGSEGRYDTGMTPTRQMKGFVDHYGSIVERQGKDLGSQAAHIEQLREQNVTLAKEGEALRSEIARLKNDIQSQREQDEPVRRALDDLRRQMLPDDAGYPAASGARIRKITLPVQPGTERHVRLPAGSFAEATLLTGVYAPTDGQAMPVKLRLDHAFVGPNRTRIPLEEAFVIGKAVGDPNSERVVIQVDRLSHAKASGETVEVAINGYVADADGVQGLAGTYVWRAFNAASLAVMSGALSAGADATAAREAIAQTNPLGGSTQTVTGDPLRFAGFRGLSRAGERLDQLVLKRLEEIVPAIYVPNGKQVTVCLIDGVTLENLRVHEVQHVSLRSPFSGLDLDR